MAVYGYSRVSTRMQADEGESLGVQERMIAGYCLMHGWTVDRMFVEGGVSGSKPFAERPEGKALLSMLRKGDVVICTRLDRGFRDAGDALNTMKALKARGISLHLCDLGDCTANGVGKLVFGILASVAEMERDRIIDRVTTVKADQKARGRYLGGKVPFGYVRGDDGALVEVPEQQEAIRTARELRASGSVLRQIREALVARHGVTLCIDAVARIVAEPVA
jgi:putative DNA-invertase from lambdoid prophage Rac